MDLKKNYGRIGVLMGGDSSERMISLKSGYAIYQALKEGGYDAVAIELNTSLEEEVQERLRQHACEAVFIALHGRFGEDGHIQKILAQTGLVYTGSDEQASRRAFHKPTTQNMLKRAGIAVPRYVSVSKDANTTYASLVQTLKTRRFVVKPEREGSSIGITLVHDEITLRKALASARQYGSHVMAEAFIAGKELTVGLLKGRVLPVVEIVPQQSFFDYEAKYQVGKTSYYVPARILDAERKAVQKAADDVFKIMGCQDFARVDFILDQGVPYCLEINTIPGFTQTSLLPMAAASAGISFNQLVWDILESAYAKKKENKTPV